MIPAEHPRFDNWSCIISKASNGPDYIVKDSVIDPTKFRIYVIHIDTMEHTKCLSQPTKGQYFKKTILYRSITRGGWTMDVLSPVTTSDVGTYVDGGQYILSYQCKAGFTEGVYCLPLRTSRKLSRIIAGYIRLQLKAKGPLWRTKS